MHLISGPVLKKSQKKKVQTLIKSGNWFNAMTLAYIIKLGFITQKLTLMPKKLMI